MIGVLKDMGAWFFLPRRFLFGENRPAHVRLPTFETLCFIDDPAEIKQVHKATGSLLLGGSGNEFLSPLLGDQSAFTMDGDAHKLARKIAGRWLTARAMHLRQSEIDEIIQQELTAWHHGGQRDIGDWARWVSMRILCKVALGVDDQDHVRRLFKRFEATTGYLANIVSYTKRFWKPRGPASVGHVVSHLVGHVDTEINLLIDRARTHLKRRPPENVLHGFVAAQQDQGYDDAFIRDNLVAILAAGYDTTGSALSWALYWLARYPDKAQSVEAFRTEVLRYCPPVEILPRRIAETAVTEVVKLAPSIAPRAQEEGQAQPLVCPVVHRVHHDPDTYPDPSAFCPERFADRHPGSPDMYMPFGAGGRMCLGVNLGKLIVDRAVSLIGERELTVITNKHRFAPVRRNVSIWPGFAFRGRLTAL
jgi:cytochrome P450